MPTYSYQCDCGERRDVFHSIHESAQLECEKCGGPMRRVLTAPAVQFKGPGFYTTDKKK